MSSDTTNTSIATTIATRLKTLRKELGFTQKEFASMMGVTLQVYQKYESASFIPGSDKIIKLLTNLKRSKRNLNLEWFFLGEGPIFLERDIVVLPVDKEFIVTETAESCGKGDYVIIPYYKEARVSAGPGAFPSDFPAEPLILPKEYLRRFFGLTSFQGLSLVPVSGRSMEMTIPDKSLAVVRDWRLDGGFFDGRVYVLVVDDLLYVKRVYFDKKNKKLYLVSDNHEVPRIEVDWDDKVHIIGRVVGCISFVEVG